MGLKGYYWGLGIRLGLLRKIVFVKDNKENYILIEG